MSTSRVGRKPVSIPSGVEVKVQNNALSIKGPKGQMVHDIHPDVKVDVEGNIIKLKSDGVTGYHRSGSGMKLLKSIVGTLRAKIANMIHGVTKGYEKKLVLVGVGYRAQAKGKSVSLAIGFSHPVDIHAPEGVTIETPTQTEIIVKGIDKHLVGHVAAMIRDVRLPENYKGKGIRYADEVVILKETKKK